MSNKIIETEDYCESPREWENPFVGGYYGKKHNYKQQSAEEISNTLSKTKEKK